MKILLFTDTENKNIYILADLRTITKHSINESTMELGKYSVQIALPSCWVMTTIHSQCPPPTTTTHTHTKANLFLLCQDVFYPSKRKVSFQIIRYFSPCANHSKPYRYFYTFCCLALG